MAAYLSGAASCPIPIPALANTNIRCHAWTNAGSCVGAGSGVRGLLGAYRLSAGVGVVVPVAGARVELNW